MKQIKYLIILLVLLPCLTSAGLVAYGTCQTACNAGAVTCYTLASAVFGVGSVPSCGVIQGKCMSACTPFLAAPTV